MNKLKYSLFYLSALLGLFACDKKSPSSADAASSASARADRDSLYSKLTEEEKRLPKNALAGLEVAEGLEATLFASEPMVGNPTNIDVDSKGRVWVCEAYNYRPEMNPDHPIRKEGDRILILEDTNGDGQADTSKVFYQGMDVNSALGITVLGNKVIVSCSPNVFMFTDEDGDDKADKKEILFSGVKGVQHDHSVHAFSFGPDGKLYFNFGNEGQQINDRNGKPVVDQFGRPVNAKGSPYRQGMVFRCNPDGSGFEVLAHNFRNNYEVAVDAYGTLWQSDNDDDGNQATRINYVMEHGSYGYTDEMTGAGWQARRTNMEEEISKRHWHLNDPGTIPNLLQTGAGSPTGLIIYEGRLLPKTFWDQIIHCDAGPNVVRSYPVQPSGAGYQAKVVNLLEGVRDQWFRPSDVCVAPDGSLIVADWYDPGVGGHQRRDTRGRLFRIAPTGKGKTYQVPAFDLSSPEKAAQALQSPNLATRYLAWEKLHGWGNQAVPALEQMGQSENPRFRARALWLLTKVEGQTGKYVEQALKDQNSDIRIAGFRAAREMGADIIPYAKALVRDPSPQVRREVAIALYHNKSAEAPQLWAELAQQHDGKDRWYLEALGIGADGQWDAFFSAWKKKVGDQWNTPAGHDIVWRSRAKDAMPLLAEQITAPTDNPQSRLRYFRAFDFHQDPSKEKVLLSLLEKNDPNITIVALSHISPSSLAKSPKLKTALDQTLTSVKGTQTFLDLLQRFKVSSYNKELLEVALAYPDSSLGIESTKVLLETGAEKLLKNSLSSKNDSVSSAVLTALKHVGNAKSMDLIQSVLMDRKQDLALRKEAVRALGFGWDGEEKLLEVVKQNQFPAELKATAVGILAVASRNDVRSGVAKFLKMPGTNEGKPLPLISQLLKEKGTAQLGERVFVQNCSSCHQVGKQGVNFGPALTLIGGKLTKEALYVAIIHPDAGISFGYEGFVFKMKDGSTVAGLITSQTADAIEIKMPGGIVSKYVKSDIVSKKAMEGSMMPSNLQQGMTEQELVDLVEYLSSLKPAGKQVAVK